VLRSSRERQFAGAPESPGGAGGEPVPRFDELSSGGTIVGAFEDARFAVSETRLHPGDLMLMYTDGLVDSLNFKEERFDVARVRQALRRFMDQPARQVLGNIRWEVRKFTGLTPRVDDLTMVAVKVG
jgi:sigma-B regulation protein RsbU (phosphoserine phosphatase)